ncbi:MAG: SH3 domain-containing protein [Parasporobacterium sp.]|nr:SH3 domain-containing protein [Parasporobacterium sp.]
MKKGNVTKFTAFTAALAAVMLFAVPVMADNYTTTPINDYLNGYTYSAVHTNNLMDVVVQSSYGYCPLKSGAGYNYGDITTIGNGTTLYITAVSQSGDGIVWGYTSYGGYAGWIQINQTRVISVENSSRAVYDVTVSVPQYISLKAGPGAEYPELYKPYNGQVFCITQTCTNSFDGRPWGLTSVNGITGWVSLNWTVRNSSVTYNQSRDTVFYNNVYYTCVSSSDGFLNMRTGPSVSCPVITPMYNGTYMTVTAAVDNSREDLTWGLTTYNGMTGWVTMNNSTVTGVENASTAAYYVSVQNSANLKLRTGPGTEYALLIDYVPQGTNLYITETVINSFDGRPWGKTTIYGTQGWVSLNWTYRAPGN